MKRLILAVLVIGVLLLSACGAPSTAPPTEATPTAPPTEPSVMSITAIELYSAYEDNEVAADAQYKGKILDVTGIVESIGKDILDTPYVVLTDGSEWAVWGVQCMFSSTDEPQLAKLSKGQEVTIRGKCDGYLINVILRKCSLGAPTTAPPVEAPPTPTPAEQPTPAEESEPVLTPEPESTESEPTPTLPSEPTPEINTVREDMIEILKANALAKWGDDYEMAQYTYENQVEAYDWVVEQTAYPDIMERAKQKWSDDYEMVQYTYENQVEAYDWIVKQTAYPDIMESAKQKWGGDYEMVKYEYENQVEAYKALQ